MKELKKTKILLLAATFIINLKVKSQCAMCKAVVESNLESGDDVGSGLNDGILYLMSAPYIVVILFGLFFFLQKRKLKKSGDY